MSDVNYASCLLNPLDGVPLLGTESFHGYIGPSD
jgi:hypothetical protein